MNAIARIGLVGCLFVTPAIAADAPNWKLFGGTDDSFLYYAAGNIERLPNDHLRVWTKGLSVKQVNSAAERAVKDKGSLSRIAFATVVDSPPLSEVKTLSKDEITDIVIEEDVANHSELQPVIRVLYELDCAGKMMRTLSIYVRKDGKTGHSNSPDEWMYVPPETNAATLHALLCGNKQQ
jgi:hypothetical protein